MALTEQSGAAGAKVPAVSVSGPDWRERRDAPVYRVELWPNRSLSHRGFRNVMLLAGLGLAVPMIALIGTPVTWALLPFVIVTLASLHFAFRRNYADGRLREVLTIWRDELRIERREPRGKVLRWLADPLKVRVRVYESGKVEKYLTLSAAGREIELGAFLSPEEREALALEVEDALGRAIRPR